MALDFFVMATVVTFMAVFFSTAVGYVRKPLAPRRDAAFLFAVLAVVGALGLPRGLPEYSWTPWLLLGAYLLQPLLMLNVARHLATIKPRVFVAVLVAAGTLALTAPLLSFPTVPPIATSVWGAAAVLYIASGNLPAALAFYREGKNSLGSRSYRLLFSAFGTLAYVIVFTLVATGVDTSWWGLQGFHLGLLAVSSFYPLAFATPSAIRNAANGLALQRAAEALWSETAAMTHSNLRTRAAGLMAQLMGTPHVAVFDADDARHGGQARALARKIHAYGAEAVTLPAERIPKEVLSAVGAATFGIHAVVVSIEAKPRLILLAAPKRASLFPDEDLSMLAGLAHHVELQLAQVDAIDQRRKDLEHTRGLEQFKSSFMRSMGHELGNPLSPIRLQIRSLSADRQGTLTEPQKRSVAIIQRNVDRLISLLDGMRDVARLEEARLDLLKEPLDLHALILDAAESHRDVADNNECVISVESRVGLTVEADRVRIGQVVDNLLSNAIKYSPNGGEISISSKAEGGQAVIQVADQGLGLTAEQQELLFNPYQRVHTDEAPKIAGTGLGLYICKGLVEAHGGVIECQSEGAGQGTTFRVRLPLPAPTSGTTVTKAPASPRPKLLPDLN